VPPAVTSVLHQPVHGAGGQQDRAAIGEDGAAELVTSAVTALPSAPTGTCVTCLRDVDRQQPVAIEVDGMRLGAGQHHARHVSPDHPGIGHLRRHQRGQPGLRHGDGAVVLDPRAGLGGLVEDQPAGAGVGVRDAGAPSRDQRADVDLGTLA
jgi:hypothetical protein